MKSIFNLSFGGKPQKVPRSARPGHYFGKNRKHKPYIKPEPVVKDKATIRAERKEKSLMTVTHGDSTIQH